MSPSARTRGRKMMLGFALLGVGTTALLLLPESDATPRDRSLDPARSEPTAEFALGEIDFGVLASDLLVRGELRARNDGETTWEVLKHWVDCGCTRLLSVGPASVAPGEELVVQLELDATGRRPGPQDRMVHVLIGPEARELTGRVRAYLVTRPEASSPILDAELDVGRNDWAARTVLIAPGLELASRVELEAVPDGVDVEVLPAVVEEGVLRHVVVASGVLSEAERERTFEFSARVFIEDHFEDGELIPLTVHVRRREPLQVSPGRVVLRRGAGGGAMLFARDWRGEPLPGLSVRVEPRGLARAALDATGGRIELTLEGDASLEQGVILLDAPGGLHREVPLRVVD